MTRFPLAQKATPALALSVVLLASLAACGGGSSADPTAQAAAAADTSTDTTQSSAPSTDGATAAAIASTEALPAYHMAPALLDEPSQVDVGGSNMSARMAPRSFNVDAAVAGIDTARLSREALVQRLNDSAKARVASAGGASTAPLSQTITGAVYTPAQIRAAYGLAPLPAVGAAISASVAATLGAGQTIYLLDAYHDATALSDLNAFSTRFGLPTCTNVAIATTAAMPLAKPPSTCTFSAVYSTTHGAMTATAPAYNGTWAPESKLDVQWAHAIAPLARIVLVEMPSSMSNNILDANTLAAKMGAGVVSMSFGSAEAAWAPTTDYAFKATGVTFVAAAGDSGAQVLWPAVSPNVVAVGGTGMQWTGSGTRYEAAWKSTGGGMSAYEALPAWQSGVTPAGGSALVRRAVPDVAFNADPMTGEWVALTAPGSTTTTWQAYGGTSIAAPQWAGIIAVANAMRAATSQAALGDIHTLLYKSIAAVPGTYASALGDVVDGTDGTCATCRAGTGFDQATGWGTPNAANLFAVLTGSSAPLTTPSPAPTVPGGSFTGTVGAALSQSLNVTVPSGTTATYALVSAPAGLAVDATGTLKWASPVAGSYVFTASAKTAAGVSASATYFLTIAGSSSTTTLAFTGNRTYNGKVGTALSQPMTVTVPSGTTVAYTLVSAPAGLTVDSTGTLKWAAPVAGGYVFTAAGKTASGQSASATYWLTIAK